MTQDGIIDKDEVLKMARHISKVLGSRMCDENGDTHGEELYCMAFDDIVDAVKLVASAASAKAVEREREACALLAQKTVCDTHIPTGVKIYGTAVAKSIRARGEAA